MLADSWSSWKLFFYIESTAQGQIWSMPSKVQVSDLVSSLALLGDSGTFKREGEARDFQITQSALEGDCGILTPSSLFLLGCCVSGFALCVLRFGHSVLSPAQRKRSSVLGLKSLKLRAEKLLSWNTKKWLLKEARVVYQMKPLGQGKREEKGGREERRKIDGERQKETQRHAKRQREGWKFFPKEEEVFRFSQLWRCLCS